MTIHKWGNFCLCWCRNYTPTPFPHITLTTHPILLPPPPPSQPTWTEMSTWLHPLFPSLSRQWNECPPQIRECIGSVIGGRVPATQGRSALCVHVVSQVWGHCILLLWASLEKVVHTVKRAGAYAAKVPHQELHKIVVRVRLWCPPMPPPPLLPPPAPPSPPPHPPFLSPPGSQIVTLFFNWHLRLIYSVHSKVVFWTATHGKSVKTMFGRLL